MKAGRRYAAGALIALGVALLIGGCAGQPTGPDEWITVGPGSRQGDVSLYRDVQFADIPVPAEYLLLTDESHSFQGSLFRNAMLVYEGRLDWLAAMDFYRRELPPRGWVQVKVDRGPDFRVFYFDKGPEKLIVVVRQTRFGSRTEMQLDNIDKNDLLLKGKLDNLGYERR